MLSKRSRLVTVWTVVVLLSLLWTAVAYAETGPTELSVPGDWTEITGDQAHWYAFEYDYNTGIEGTDDSTYALVRMFVTEPENGAVFTIWTQEQIDDMAEFDANEAFVPDKWLGCGAFNDSDSIKGDYLWAGNTLNDGMYYVKVERSGLDPDAVYYKLEMLGDDVTVVEPPNTGLEMVESPAAPMLEEKAIAKAETAAVVANVKPGDLVPTISLAPGDWRELQSDEDWFAFNYNANYGVDGDETPNQMFIRMWIDGPENGAEFSVWDKEGLEKLYTYDKDREPEFNLCIGCGAFTEAVSADYVWEGNFKASDTYYVRVKPTGLNTTEPIIYKLEIAGEDVAIVTPMADVAAAAPAMESEPVAVEAAVAMEAEPAAIAIETAMEPEVAAASVEPAIGEWMALQPAEEHWYQFNYRADFGIDGDGSPSNIEIAMYVEEPENGAEFTVWTEEQLKKLNEWDENRNYDDLCVGCGTLNDAVDPDYTWSGNFKSSGTYYVRVKPTGLNTDTVVYKLNVEGDDISF